MSRNAGGSATSGCTATTTTCPRWAMWCATASCARHLSARWPRPSRPAPPPLASAWHGSMRHASITWSNPVPIRPAWCASPAMGMTGSPPPLARAWRCRPKAACSTSSPPARSVACRRRNTGATTGRPRSWPTWPARARSLAGPGSALPRKGHWRCCRMKSTARPATPWSGAARQNKRRAGSRCPKASSSLNWNKHSARAWAASPALASAMPSRSG